MKTLKNISAFLTGIVLTIACNEGIDPISQVNPGPDSTPPLITVTFPFDGYKFFVLEDTTSIDIQFEATDDIELQSISVQMDGTELANYSDFKDYRRFLEKLTYDKLSTAVHVLTITATDLSGKVSVADIHFEKSPEFIKQFDGEIFYMPFNGNYMEVISRVTPTVVGAPDFAGGKIGSAYKGATDSYLSMPTTGLTNNEFSAAFWYKVNASPDRAGIITISPAGLGFDESRTHGLRFFREGSASSQTIKLNVGLGGNKESWNDGKAINASSGDWVHLAFTISETQSAIYINGELARSPSTLANPIDWAGCDNMSIGSAQPDFIAWEHFADLSLIDELYIFNKALSQDEVKAIINSK